MEASEEPAEEQRPSRLRMRAMTAEEDDGTGPAVWKRSRTEESIPEPTDAPVPEPTQEPVPTDAPAEEPVPAPPPPRPLVMEASEEPTEEQRPSRRRERGRTQAEDDRRGTAELIPEPPTKELVPVKPMKPVPKRCLQTPITQGIL